MSTPILPYSSGLSPLSSNPIRSLDDQYLSNVDSLVTLGNLDTRYMLTGTRRTITISGSDEFWKLYNGTADPTYPTDQVAAYNSDTNAAVRFWQKTGGY